MGNQIAVWQTCVSKSKPIEILLADPVPTSLDEATRRLPSGGYTTFRTFGLTRVLRLEDHFARLEVTAKLAGKPIKIDRKQIKQDLRSILSQFSYDDARVRIILDLEDNAGMLFYLIEELHVPSDQDYAQGVKVVTKQMHRTNPAAKLTQFIVKADEVREELSGDAHEALMVSDDGRILEGLSSNFFAVQNSTVWTANEGMLPGITRSMVIDVIKDLGIPLHMEPVQICDIFKLEEAFITSASRSVLPVTSINRQPVGNGLPGRVTKIILERYLEQIEKELEIF